MIGFYSLTILIKIKEQTNNVTKKKDDDDDDDANEIIMY
jgi:hypothetical protein